MRARNQEIKVRQILLSGGWHGAIYSDWNFPSEVIAGWNRMSKNYGDVGIFITYGWFETWWQVFGDSGILQVIVLLKDQEPKAIFPLWRKTDEGKGNQGANISSLTNDHSYFFDFIIDPSDRVEALSLFTQIVGKIFPDDEIYLEYIPMNGDNVTSFINGLQQSWTPFQKYSEPWAPWIRVSGNIVEFEKTLPGRLRNGLKRCWKKAGQEGKIRLEIIKQSQSLDEKLDILFDVEYRSWKGQQGTAIKCQKDVEKFYRKLAHWAMGNDSLRLFLLWLGDVPVAASYCLSSGETVFLIKPGYREDFKHLSPGNLLQHEVFKSLYESPEITNYNFLGACNPWKMEWTSETGESGWVRVYPKTLRGWSRYYFKYGWKNSLKSIGLVRKLKAGMEKKGLE